MNKALMGFVVVLLCSTLVQSQTVTILESQIIHPLQDMDARWESACNEIGYTTSIVSYDFLDQPCIIDQTDILIISSAVLAIEPSQVLNLNTFVESGGSLYLQGEFLDTFPGNRVFKEMVGHFGDNFTWGVSGNEDIGPLGVGSIISNNYNSVDSLEYFWYGLDGTGTGPFTSLLSKDTRNYGYLYEPEGPYNGKIICTTDQDWIRLDFGQKVIENIAAIFQVNPTPFQEVVVTTNDQNFCLGAMAQFEANLNFTFPNAPTPTFQWTINGIPANGANSDIFTTDILQDGDVVECQLSVAYGCKQYDNLSNPILMAPIFPINTASVNMEISQLNTCATGSNEFEIIISNPDGISINSIEWTWNNIVLSNSASSSLTMNDLTNGDQLSIRYSIVDPCYGLTWVDSDDLSVVIEQAVTPTVNLNNPTLEFCEGDQINYSISGDHWGTNPSITWLVNGLTTASTTTNFDATQLSAGTYNIQAVVESSELCVVNSEASTSPIVIEINELRTLDATLTSSDSEICAGEMATFSIDPIFIGDNPTIEWFVDGQNANFSGLEYQSSTLTNGQTVHAVISSTEACYTAPILSLDPITVTINEIETPYIIIDADFSKVCPGTEVNLQSSGDFLGDNPVYNWYVNGDLQNVQNGTFAVVANEELTTVELMVESNEECISQTEAYSETLEIATAPMKVQNETISPEHCGQKDGAVSLDIDGGFGLITSSFSINQNNLALENLEAGEIILDLTDSLGCRIDHRLTIPEELGPSIEELNILQPNCDNQTTGAGFVSVSNANDVSIYWMNENADEVATGRNAPDLDPGIYLVEVMDDYGCISREEFAIENVVPVFTTGDQEFLVSLGENLELNPNAVSGGSDLTYSWEGNQTVDCIDCASLNISPVESGRYQVTITNETGCSNTVTYLVKVRKNYDVYLPNAFSPNGDGNNDFWNVFVGDEVASVDKITIFNRWGATVFQASDVSLNEEQAGWNGNFKNQQSGMGVYVVSVEVTFKDGDRQVFNGDITLTK